jgi:hypothetical protein
MWSLMRGVAGANVNVSLSMEMLFASARFDAEALPQKETVQERGYVGYLQGLVTRLYCCYHRRLF